MELYAKILLIWKPLLRSKNEVFESSFPKLLKGVNNILVNFFKKVIINLMILMTLFYLIITLKSRNNWLRKNCDVFKLSFMLPNVYKNTKLKEF